MKWINLRNCYEKYDWSIKHYKITMMWMFFHYMILYYKANRLIEKISIFLLPLSTWDPNPDRPSACFPLNRRNPHGFSGISQPDKASPSPVLLLQSTELAKPCSAKEILTGPVGGWRWGARLESWLGLAEKLWPELGIATADLWKSTAAGGSSELWGEEVQGASFSSQLGKETKPPLLQAWMCTSWH